MKFQRIEAAEHNHALGDPRKPTAYRVLDGEGRELGRVFTVSTKSWAESGRSRTRLLGYLRAWVALDPASKRVGYHHYSRAAAAEALEQRVRPAKEPPHA